MPKVEKMSLFINHCVIETIRPVFYDGCRQYCSIDIDYTGGMYMNLQPNKVGTYIAALRKAKGMTQADLAERLNLSFQAVSKWERGECLPDAGILLELADVLNTTADSLLRGGETTLSFRGKISVENIIKGIEYLFELPRLIGKDNTIYQGMIEGINRKMNLDWHEDLKGRDERWSIELFSAEVIIQELKHGKYVDISEVNRLFTLEKWRNSIIQYSNSYGIK